MRCAPCKGCKERKENCHSECERYQEFLKDNEKIRKARKEDTINRSTIFRANHYN